jgi:hypothetical protein
MITFFITFLLMLLSGSIFTLGFFTITRGKIITLPNGNEVEEKEILGSWEIFWMQIERYEKVFYYDKQLEFKLKVLEQLKPAYMGLITFSNDKEKKSLFFDTMPNDSEIRDIEFSLNCNVFKHGAVIFLYDEIPVYRFSEWVRKMTNCHVCLAGWLGGLYYLLLIKLFPDAIVFEHHSILCKTIFLIIYCISLAFVNKSIKEFFDNDKK